MSLTLAFRHLTSNCCSSLWIPSLPIHKTHPRNRPTKNAWGFTGTLWPTSSPRKIHTCSTFVLHIQQFLHTIQLLLFRILPSSWALQMGNWTLCTFSFFPSIYQHRFHSGYEIQFRGCMVSFIIRHLVLFCHMFAVYNAAFHPYHILDRCTAHNVGISGIPLRAISMEVTHMSLTVTFLQYNTVPLFSAVCSRYSIF